MASGWRKRTQFLSICAPQLYGTCCLQRAPHTVFHPDKKMFKQEHDGEQHELRSKYAAELRAEADDESAHEHVQWKQWHEPVQSSTNALKSRKKSIVLLGVPVLHKY